MPFAYLGLDADADEREVRRAYAKRLKTTRPDDDPVAFQRLHEAYAACLDRIARRRWEEMQADGDDDDDVDAGDGETASAAMAEPEPEPEIEAGTDTDDSGTVTIEFAFAPFIDELLPQVLAGDAPALLRWLYAHPDLYSFQLKQVLAMEVLRIVAEHEPPMPMPTLDALTAFFGLDDIGAHGEWLRERIRQARDAAALRARFRQRPLPRERRDFVVQWIDTQIDDDLLAPAAWWRTAMLLLLPGQLRPARERVLELERLGGDAATAVMAPAKRALYLELGDRAVLGWRRFALSAARTGLYGSVVLLAAQAMALDLGPAARAVAIAGGAAMLGHVLLAGWLRALAALDARFGNWSHELGIAGLWLAGAGVVALGSGARLEEAFFGGGYALMIAAALRALTVPRSLVGMVILMLLITFEGIVGGIAKVPLPPLGVLSLGLTAALPLALDRWMNRGLRDDPRRQAANPRPLQIALFVLFVVLVAAGFGAILLFPPT